MSCDQYRKYELGELDEERFRSHERQCPSCQETMRQNAELMALAGSLKQPIEAPFLWGRIEAALSAETEKTEQKWSGVFCRHRTALYRIAAVLVVGVGMGAYLNSRSASEPSRLLSASALERVEEQEQEYIQAIEELEQVASVQLAQMDLDLMLLYRDKLETIDAQIDRCQKALRSNPANVHIRRYLLLALQDKKEALQEVVAYQTEL